MNKFKIEFRLGKSIFERAIDPKYYIDDLKEVGKVEVDIIEENMPSLDETVTDEHKFYADIIVETDKSQTEIEEILEFIIEDGVKITPLEEEKKEEPSESIEDVTETTAEIPKSLLDNYLNESEEIIIHLGEVIQQLYEESGNSELINEIFRGFHTLKGNTGILLTYGKNPVLEAIKDIAHSTEGVLQKVRDKGLSLNDNQIEVLQELVDKLDDLLINFKENSNEIPGDIYDLLTQLDKGGEVKKGETSQNTEGLSADVQAVIKVCEQYIPEFKDLSQKTEYTEEEVEFLKRAFITLYKMTKNLGLKEIFEAAKELQILLGNNDYTKLKQQLSNFCEIADKYIKEQISTISKSVEKKQDKKSDLTKYLTKTNYLRIDEKIVQNVMDIVGEISVFKEWLNFFTLKLQREYQNIEASKELKEKYQRFKNLVENLQNAILEMRMVPLSTLFERFPKLVRDLSRQLGKKVKFVVEGGDTNLDKVIVEKIGEPMIHLIRNALDHGLETPDKRKEVGKPEEGTLKITAYQSAGNVVIEIKDDGAGIDPEKVKRKAIEKGLKTEEEIEKMSDEEIINLIFLPGFSTKDVATEVSGRGVGTDAVLAAVSEFGGNVSVSSTVGLGSTFTVTLPLTLAIQKILLTQVGELTVGIPADMISEIVKIQEDEISKFNELNVIHHRNKVIEVKYAHDILKLKKIDLDKELTLLIDNFQEKAFVVDKVISTIDTVIKPAPDIIQNIEEISGITILGDGSIVYIIDIMN